MKKYLFITSIVIIWTVVTQAQWQPDVRLTYDPAQSYMSNPNKHCIASSGNVLHVVWHDERTNWDIYYKRSPDAGSSWSTDTRLSVGSGESHEAALVASGSMLHVVWHDNRDGHWEIYYKRSTDGGINWGVDTHISDIDAFSSNTSSLAISGSILHAVWQDERDGNWEIYRNRSTDGGTTWGVDSRLTSNNAVSIYPSVSASGSYVHVVWFDNRDGNNEIYYKRSTDNGISWGADTRLSDMPFVSELATLSATGSAVYVVWQDSRDGNNNEVYYKRSTDGGTNWGNDTRLTNNSANSDAPNITVTGSNIHVTWQDTRDGNHEIYYKRSTDGGVSWGPDTRLTNNAGTSVRSFSTVTGTAVNVVWMDTRDGNWEIYYKQDPTGNPILEPPPTPNLYSPPNGSFNQPTSIRFIWYKALYAASYRLQISLDSLFANMVINDSTITDSTILVANLTTNKYYWWRVNAKNAFGTSPYSAVWKFGTFPVGLKELGNDIPKEFKLYNNYPNPFNPITKIKFDIPLSRGVDAEGGRGVFVRLVIYDVLGRQVALLVNELLKPSTYEAGFDGTDFPSGVYLYKLETSDYADTKRMVLVK